MAGSESIKTITAHGLRVTPQRTAILQAIIDLNDHPSTESLMKYIRSKYPNISLSTVYNTLRLFNREGIIRTVSTGNNVSRLDPVMKNHHHIHWSDSDKIIDFEDMKLDNILKNYFFKNQIPGLEIEKISVQVSGKSKTKTHNKHKKPSKQRK